MTKISFIEGVQCRKCGKIAQGNCGAEITLSTPSLCQTCGAFLMVKDTQNATYRLTKDGCGVIIKATKKMFSTTYEVVREI